MIKFRCGSSSGKWPMASLLPDSLQRFVSLTNLHQCILVKKKCILVKKKKNPGQLSFSPPMSFSFSWLIAAVCKSSPPITYIHHFHCHRHHFYCHLRCHSVWFLTLFKHQVGISSHSAPGRCSMNLFTLRSAIIITIVAIIIASVVIISLRTCGITFFILLSAYQQKISTLRHLHIIFKIWAKISA